MQTKYDAGDTILLQAEVTGIETHGEKIYYRVRESAELIPEETICGKIDVTVRLNKIQVH